MEDWEYTSARDLDLPLSEKIKSHRRESGLLASLIHLSSCSFIEGYIRLVHRLRIRGRNHIPGDPPYLLVANHTSHLDTLALLTALPWKHRDRVIPLAAGDHFFESTLTSLLTVMTFNALPVWRREVIRESLEEFRTRLLELNEIFILFPEGTRSRDGELTSFKGGVGMMVAGTRVPVVPCYLEGAFAALPPHRKFPRPESLQLQIGKPLTFEKTDQNKSAWNQIAARLEEAVRRLKSESGSISES